jgi:hypothetical protein
MEEIYCNHPERKKDEIFLGNGVEIHSRYSSLKTVRYGEKAYELGGNLILNTNLRPIFINKSEEKEHDRLMKEAIAQFRDRNYDA